VAAVAGLVRSLGFASDLARTWRVRLPVPTVGLTSPGGAGEGEWLGIAVWVVGGEQSENEGRLAVARHHLDGAGVCVLAKMPESKRLHSNSGPKVDLSARHVSYVRGTVLQYHGTGVIAGSPDRHRCEAHSHQLRSQSQSPPPSPASITTSHLARPAIASYMSPRGRLQSRPGRPSPPRVT
jgi:hypothetical protein